MKEINRKRLEWLAKPEERPSTGLGFDTNVWRQAVSEAAQDALAELDSYRGIKVETSLVTGNQIVWIDGIKYARELFQSFAETPLNQCLRIVTRDAGLLQIERLPTWQPIETAPVPPYDPEREWECRLRCLLQLPGRNGGKTTVIEGEGYWVAPRPNRKVKTPELRWRAQYLGVVHPTHWQPLPMPFNEPLNEESVA